MVFRDKTTDGTTRLTGGAVESGGSSDWNDILNKPSTFPPSAHTHSIGAVTGLQDELDDLNDTVPHWVAGSYKEGRIVQHLGRWFRATADTTDEPGLPPIIVDREEVDLFALRSHSHDAEDTTTGTFAPERLPDATEATKGAAPLATSAQATEGTDTTRIITPALLKQEIDKAIVSSITIWGWLTHLVDVGDYLLPKGFSTSQVYNPTSGLATFSKIILGRHSTYSHIGYYTTTAAVGGSVSLQFALYGSDSEGSKPDTSNRLGLTLVDDMTTGANRALAFASPVSLEPGVYWVGSLYRVLSTPTTSPQMRGADIVASDVSSPGIFWFNQTIPARCRELSGQTELPNADTTPTWSYSAMPPFVGLKRSG